MDAISRTVQAIRSQIDEIAKEVVTLQLDPLNYSEVQKEATFRDAKYNIEQLSNAIELGSEVLFNDYLVWLRDILRACNLQDDLLINHLKLIESYAETHFDKEMCEIIMFYIINGIKSIQDGAGESVSYLEDAGEYQPLATEYFDLLMHMKRAEAIQLIMDAIEQNNISIEDLYVRVFSNVLYEVGRQWARREITVGQEHYATAVTVYTMSMLYSKIFTSQEKKFKMIGICVGEELHEIGIRMVCDIFEMHEWDTYYLGANVPVETVISEIQRISPNLVAISVTMVNKVSQSKSIIDKIKSHSINTKVIVGGRPFNGDIDLWKRIGADGYSKDAEEALIVARNLMR